MSDIFISYSSSDRETAQHFANALEGLGWSVWWDREIPLGKTYDQVIEQELNAAHCVLVLWSKESVLSRWVKTEASAAADRERLVPVLLDNVAIPLEFRRIQTAMLPAWDGDTADPEFQRLLDAVRDMLGQPQTTRRLTKSKTQTIGKFSPWWQLSPRFSAAVIGALILVVGVLFVKRRFVDTRQPARQEANTTTPSSRVDAQNPARSSPTAVDSRKSAEPKDSFPIRIGDRIDNGIPVAGAGNIETPFSHNAYVFTATPGQKVYFRMLSHSKGMASIKWRLTDPDGTEVFNTCLGCTEPGVQPLTKGGTYTLTVGSANDAATGTYQLRLFDVPPPNRFAIKIGYQIKENLPGAGAGVIESPGAEDIYTFSAVPRQRVYFRMYEHSAGMAYIGWKVVDEDGTEVFNTCLGCTEPGVQALIKGGTYTLTVGNKTNPTTGTYRLQLFDVPPPNQFAIKIGDRVKPGSPGPGAGAIESPGAEDIYAFTANAGQKVYFHLLEPAKDLTYINWRLQDDNGMELFNSCLGCSEPGVQTLIKGGKYTLTVGNRTNPATGNYSFETGTR